MGRLIETARTLDGAGLAAASLCAGWTRGHVLSHIARNADAYVNLLTWARTGVETPAYAEGRRDADIEAGAARPLAEQLDDLRASGERFAAAVEAMTTDNWAVTVRGRSGEPIHATSLVWARLREVEVHHVDLDAGYGPADWPAAFTTRLLHEITRTLPGFSARLVAEDLGQTLTLGSPGPTVGGPGHAIAAWLIGRGDGNGLTVTPTGDLPAVPRWK